MTTNVTFLTRAVGALTDTLERAGQNRARAYLLGLSDSHLRTLGFSRELIKLGPTAWPWYTDDQLGASISHGAAQEIKPVSELMEAEQDRNERPYAETKRAA